MTDVSRYEQALRRILYELRPYLDDIVVIGGWVPHLYRRYGGFATWAAGISLTAEVDILVERPLPATGRQPIAEILGKANFRHSEEDGGNAVWEGDVHAGELIEFLVSHEGIARAEGRVIPVAGQEGVGAIPLEGLDLLRTFKLALRIPVTSRKGEQVLAVFVPTLGAYAVNKATTFLRRGALVGGGNPKQAKDLLYLRDLMAAGDEVVRRIEADLAEIAAWKGTRQNVRGAIGTAGNNLYLVLHGAPRKLLPEVGAMLVEREAGTTAEAANADIEGHLTDLLELLATFASEG